MATITEGELTFEFPPDWQVEQFDSPGTTMPWGMKPVDFIVDFTDRVVLIEVKDPSHSRAPTRNRDRFVRKMQTNTLTHEELVPKARTTYSYLHLMDRDDRPLHYLVVIGAEALSLQPLLVIQLTDRLRRRLRQEAAKPWARQYIASAQVITTADLPRALPGLTVHRTPTPTATATP